MLIVKRIVLYWRYCRKTFHIQRVFKALQQSDVTNDSIYILYRCDIKYNDVHCINTIEWTIFRLIGW